MYTLGEIAQITGGRLVGNENKVIRNILFDSRKINQPSLSMFVAIKTPKGDGHHYIQQVADASVAAVLSEQAIQDVKIDHVLVDDSLRAVQKLAAHRRSNFDNLVVGITGSNGKTMVKEWLWQLLKETEAVYRSPKSYNSQLGVALSLWSLDQSADIALIEAGISKPGEMALLEEMIRPNIGIFTHFGDAHGIHFSSEHEKLREKLSLFNACKMVIHQEDDEVSRVLKEMGVNSFSWGNQSSCDVQIIDRSHRSVSVYYDGETLQFSLPFNDPVSFENGMTCIAFCLYHGLAVDMLKNRLLLLETLDMRLQQVDGVNGNSLILDYYNADLQSLDMALSYQSQQSKQEQRVLIVSDITESAYSDDLLYEQIGLLINRYNIDLCIGIGPKLSDNADAVKGMICYESTEQFLDQYPFYQLHDSSILLKGSRMFKFERIAAKLRTLRHRTVLEVNMSHLQHNLNLYKERIGREVKLMAMVKAFAYGSGGYQVAKLLEFNNIDYLGVAYTDEGVSLRKAGIHSPILVLNPDIAQLDDMLDHGLEPTVYSLDYLHELILKLDGRAVDIHIEFDTGMHRLGFEEHEIPEILTALEQNENITLRSVFSHLSSADDFTQDNFTNNQIQSFTRICSNIKGTVSNTVICHIANTAGIERFPNGRFDMVRLGIGLYGIGAEEQDDDLQVVGTFKSYISQIRKVKAHEGIGYGQHSTSDSDRQIAVVSVGYADGLNRKLSQGNGYFIVNGQRAPIVGNVCMDMTMCDVSDIVCNTGDEVIVFGQEPTVQELANRLDTIPYEVLTSVSERVPRIFYQE